MPDLLLYILIGSGLCYAAGHRIKPPPLKAVLIAVFAVLTLLNCLNVPAARYSLITAGMLLIAVACWNGGKQPERVPALLLFAVLFGILPIIGLIRQLSGSYPYRGRELAELLFNCLVCLPAGIASIISLLRILYEKYGHNGPKRG